MRLHEIARPTFYLAMSIKQSVRDEISAQVSVYPLGSLLEHRRPANRLPRSKSLYLQASPQHDAEYVYKVMPIGQMDRLHTSWLQRLQGASVENDGEIDQLVRGYWSGEVMPERRGEAWECRVLWVKVTALVDQRSI